MESEGRILMAMAIDSGCYCGKAGNVAAIWYGDSTSYDGRVMRMVVIYHPENGNEHTNQVRARDGKVRYERWNG